MAAITTVVRSDSVIQDRLVLSMEKFATKLDDSAAFFLKLTQRLGGIETVNRMKHSYRELRLMPMAVTTTAAVAAAATTIPVSDGSYFRADDLVYDAAAPQLFRVVSVSGNTLTVATSTTLATGVTTAIAAGRVLLNLMESHAEGEDIPAARAVDQTVKDVYLYQFDETCKHTDIQINEEDYGQAKIDEDRELAMIHQLRALNLNYYVGTNVREILSAVGPRRHIMAGLEYFLWSTAINAANIAGGLTMAAFGEIIRPTKAYSASSAEKYALCGTNAWKTISAFANNANAVRIQPGADQSWGVTVNRLLTAFGTINVAYDNVLAAENGLADRMFIIDPKFIGQLQMRGLPLVMKTNIKGDTDPHNVTDLITGTRGMKLKLVELHKEVYGIG